MAPARRFAPLQILVILAVILLVVSPAAAQRVRQLTEYLATNIGGYAVDDTGSVAFFTSDVDPLGTNPYHVMQVFKMTLPGGVLDQVTTLDSDAHDVSVSDDGTSIAFVSAANPLGTNADRGGEVFLTDSTGGSMIQLTDHPASGGNAFSAALCGDASTVLLVSSGDPIGTNPSGYVQLFAIDTDGTSIVPLTSTSGDGEFLDFAISDDGTRIAFIDSRDLAGANADGSYELFSVLSDGSGLTQVTGDTNVHSLDLGGQGSPIVFATETNALYTVDWNSTHPALRDTESGSPSITDNGKLYYAYLETGSPAIRMLDLKVGTPVTVWNGSVGPPVISGTGNRMLFSAPYQLLATDGAGDAPELLIETSVGRFVASLEMSADGRRVVFPWGSDELHVADTETAALTALSYSGYSPSINGDGSMIVFNNFSDLVPETCPGTEGGIYCVGADGSGLLQLAPDPATCDSADLAQHAMISDDGERVVFQSAGRPAGPGIGGNAELYGVAGTGGPISLVTDDDSSTYKNPRIDGTGTWAVYHSDANITGENPDGYWQVFRIRMDGTGVEQLSTLGGVDPDISADGSKIVYWSDADPLGTNADGNYEIFLYDTTAATTEQLTMTTSGENDSPRISPNGQYVVFGSTSPWVSSSLGLAVYRIELATGELLLASAGGARVDRTHRDNGTIDVSNTGSVAFLSTIDLVRRNPDNSTELWLAEFDGVSSVEPGKDSPTVVHWGPLPWALSYDVIRGDVANLAAGTGGSVDLGAVVCLENDSTDATTFGFGDDAEPGVGEVLFYLYRGWGGDLVGDGDWGTGSGGAERTPSSGSCPDGP